MRNLSALAAILAAVFLLITGNGLSGTLIPLRAKLDGFSASQIGALGSAYFAGMLAGAMVAGTLVRRAGYIRAFAAFVALAVTAMVTFPAALSPIPWIALRLVHGFALAGLYAVIEGWIQSRATNENRGALYAVYQVVNFGASAAGQGLMALADPRGVAPFSVAAAMLAMSILPLAFTSADPPERPRATRPRILWLVKQAPVGATSALIVGATNGAYWALAPVYALAAGLTPNQAPALTASVILGSALVVYPVGRLSDRLDRRIVVVAFSALGALVETALCFALGFGLWPLLGLGFLLGATTFVLYTLSTGLANDRVGPDDRVVVSSGLLFLYCVGAVIAPAVASGLMERFGAAALFAQSGALHAILAGFALWRLTRRDKAEQAPIARAPEGKAAFP
ncbi:MAG: MFS transporter [Hyphomicrobiales bacterium]|nr:MFS transporter [Hyphomicrobiales bacterium]MDE2017081.1 MFS transporter [Hyphomicrobiales bacterium]